MLTFTLKAVRQRLAKRGLVLTPCIPHGWSCRFGRKTLRLKLHDGERYAAEVIERFDSLIDSTERYYVDRRNRLDTLAAAVSFLTSAGDMLMPKTCLYLCMRRYTNEYFVSDGRRDPKSIALPDHIQRLAHGYMTTDDVPLEMLLDALKHDTTIFD